MYASQEAISSISDNHDTRTLISSAMNKAEVIKAGRLCESVENIIELIRECDTNRILVGCDSLSALDILEIAPKLGF